MINFMIGLIIVIRDEDYVKFYVGGGYVYWESGNVDLFIWNRFIVWFVFSLLFVIFFKIVFLILLFLEIY